MATSLLRWRHAFGQGSGIKAWVQKGEFRDIEILADSSGKPQVTLYGNALRQAQDMGMDRLAISLSHCREYAVPVLLVKCILQAEFS
jgi:phosphopantetheinyl transferase (holo-ACP synthase)